MKEDTPMFSISASSLFLLSVWMLTASVQPSPIVEPPFGEARSFASWTLDDALFSVSLRRL